ncbi:MAG: hypothetical protein O3C60_09395 [Planctomycetota bacterium]|nr:hypothetical protein [Planctomycetota bacterium]
MGVFGVTVFLSAFLLFQVQPLIAKTILPWYGSSPAVWTACMLFFQSLLLGGYTYAHLSATLLGRKTQGVVHLGLLLLAAISLPIAPSPPTQVPGDNPTWQILVLLLRSVGFPYLLLSASGPLFQAWFTLRYPNRSHYRLYSLSNIGSLTALLSYPLVVEPSLNLGQQNFYWSLGFVGLAISASGCVWALFQRPVETALMSGGRSASGRDLPPNPLVADTPPTGRLMLKWFVYSMVGTVVLLAITNQMCQDIAVVPFMWVLPLSAYLLSFILCFESDSWYRRVPFLIATVGGSILLCLTLVNPESFPRSWQEALYGRLPISLPMWWQVALHVGLCFSCCMCCHGELARLRPGSSWSTLFYLTVAAGGALGGIAVAIVAPVIFLQYWELDLGLAATCLLVWMEMVQDAKRPVDVTDGVTDRSTRAERRASRKHTASIPSSHHARRPPGQVYVSCIGVAVLLAEACLGWHIYRERANVLRVERNFYGVISVVTVGARKILNTEGVPVTEVYPELAAVALYHGRILHGTQFQMPSKREKALLYYDERSGVGRAIEKHPQRVAQPDHPFRIGVIGLGTGTLAAYAKKGDYVRFYEINPSVLRIADGDQDYTSDLSEIVGTGSAAGENSQPSESSAQVQVHSQEGLGINPRFFSYLHDARKRGATVETSLGDARVLLDHSLRDGHSEQFDVLAIDAFSGDAIPLHLLTQECLDLYLRHLAPDGVVAYHISNIYLNLEPIVHRLAAERSLQSLTVRTHTQHDLGIEGSRWVLVSRDRTLQTRSKDWPEAFLPTPADLAGPLWTDDFSSIAAVVQW